MEKILDLINDLAANLSVEVGALLDDKLSSSAPEREISDLRQGAALSMEAKGPVEYQGYTFLKVDLEDRIALVLYVKGALKEQQDLLFLLERYVADHYESAADFSERNAFLKNVLLENELPGDIPLKAQEFDIQYSLPRKVMLLRLTEKIDDSGCELAEQVLSDKLDTMFAVDEHNLVILLTHEGIDEDEVDSAARKLVDRFAENGRQIYIGIGLEAPELKDCATSYRQADLALTVGSIFYENDRIMWYNRLGLGRLIYQLPPTLCRMFLSEVFEPDAYESLDPETLLTIEKFFENNLNGSETARQLFVHRNTLVYRLDKVEKITGLDLRTFDDAVLFKLASMVRKYLEHLQRKGEAYAVNRRWQ